MVRQYDNAREMDKAHPMSPQNQVRYGMSGGVLSAVRNFQAYRTDAKKHYQTPMYRYENQNIIGSVREGGRDEYGEVQAHEELKKEIKKGKQIVTNEGETVEWSQEAIAQKIQEGFRLVHVNFEHQRSDKMYTYLSNENLRAGNTATAPFTYSDMFNPTMGGRSGYANVIVKSVTQALQNAVGLSAYLETKGKQLKQIGGGIGNYIGSDGYFAQTGYGIKVGGGRHYGQRGQAISAGMKASKQGGQNATQTIS